MNSKIPSLLGSAWLLLALWACSGAGGLQQLDAVGGALDAPGNPAQLTGGSPERPAIGVSSDPVDIDCASYIMECKVTENAPEECKEKISRCRTYFDENRSQEAPMECATILWRLSPPRPVGEPNPCGGPTPQIHQIEPPGQIVGSPAPVNLDINTVHLPNSDLDWEEVEFHPRLPH